MSIHGTRYQLATFKCLLLSVFFLSLPTNAQTSRSAQEAKDNTNANSIILKTIQEIAAESTPKSEYESRNEYIGRINVLQDKYSGRTFDLRRKCGRRITRYDAEAKELVIEFPEGEMSLATRLEKDVSVEKKFFLLYSSFTVSEEVESSELYTAMNSLGAKFNVEKVRVKIANVAVLSADPIPQAELSTAEGRAKYAHLVRPVTFREKVSLERARTILEGNCTVSIGVETIYSEKLSFRDSPLLLVEENEQKPTISRTVHSLTRTITLPVKMNRIELFDQDEVSVFAREARR